MKETIIEQSNYVLKKIRTLLAERNWSVYRLAHEADLPYSSLNNLFVRNNCPTLNTLEKICDGFEMSISEFFKEYKSEDQHDCYSYHEKQIIHTFRQLDDHCQKLFLAYLAGLAHEEL